MVVVIVMVAFAVVVEVTVALASTTSVYYNSSGCSRPISGSGSSSCRPNCDCNEEFIRRLQRAGSEAPRTGPL